MRLLASLTVCALTFLVSAGVAAQPAAHASVRMIFDTDMWADIDDVLALAMLHALQDRGEVDLLAVTISTEEKWCASYVDAVDTFYGHSHIPVGLVKDGISGSDVFKRFPTLKPPGDVTYTQFLSERQRSDGSLVYPHALLDGSQAPEAVSLLRKILAAQPDGSVVMIQVGYSTNLARLLESKSDMASPLDGYSLVKRKIRLLSIMAGKYAESEWNGRRSPKGSPEFNIVLDVPSARLVFEKWPTPIVASGFEIGLTMLFRGLDINRRFSYTQDHPVAESYRYADRTFRLSTTGPDALHDHPTFDLTSVLYAARPDEDYFSLSKAGSITILPDGGTRFDENESGNRHYLIMTDAQKIRALEAMTLLASQPPIQSRQQR